MKCGHAANAKDKRGNPVCVICTGIVKGWDQIDDKPPSLEGRVAKCGSCKNTKPSSTELAFFEYTPSKPQDMYYCGCGGWD